MNIQDASLQASLAFAAYAKLATGLLNTEEQTATLVSADMSRAQAEEFARNWKVIDKVDSINGLQAFVFEDLGPSHKRYLAIRGTLGSRRSKGLGRLEFFDNLGS